jgi:hypothetical protein
MPRLHIELTAVALLAVGCGEDGPCDPIAQTGCEDGNVCENVVGKEPACFAPVAIEGRVFDLDDDSGIDGARVVAVDVNGAAVSNVVKSGEDGKYKLPIPTDRNPDGTPVALSGNVTLRADAQDYASFPGTVRQPLPIDIATATKTGSSYIVKSALTDIGMLAGLSGQTGSITGTVERPDDITGVVVVAEKDGIGYAAIAARNGDYAILNLPPGAYNVTAYAIDHNFLGATADVTTKAVDIDIKLSADAPSPISGSVQFADAGGLTTTSIVLFIESTYDSGTGRGVTVPGLRAPRTGVPDVTGPFTMEGVPAGKYVVVAAFENDGLVRDPDLCIAGTDDVHIQVAANTPLAIAESFKVTGALAVMTPGAMSAELVTGTPTFQWVDDSAEDQYLVELFDSYGRQVWNKTINGVSGTNPSVPYDGPALTSGGYYQFRVTSSATGGGQNPTRCNRSRTEDLKGVFYTP